MPGPYLISEIAEMTGLTREALRYYERMGLLESPERGSGETRLYSDVDLAKIRFLLHLRNTHMPLKNIREYVQAYNAKDEARCYELLDEHRISIENQFEEMKRTLNQINYKLEHFQRIKDGVLKEE